MMNSLEKLFEETGRVTELSDNSSLPAHASYILIVISS